MTLDELVVELQKLQEQGYGNLKVYKQTGPASYDTLVKSVSTLDGEFDYCPDYMVDYVFDFGDGNDRCIFIR